jgi:hypothetical protein
MFGDLHHLDDDGMDGFFADYKEQVHHELVELGSGIVVGKEGEIMLTEHAKTIHSKFVNEVQDFRDGFGDFLLELSDYFENIVVAKNCVHSDDDLSHDDKYIFLYLAIDSHEQLSVLDPNRIQDIDDDIEQNVVHALGVLNTRVGQRQ